MEGRIQRVVMRGLIAVCGYKEDGAAGALKDRIRSCLDKADIHWCLLQICHSSYTEFNGKCVPYLEISSDGKEIMEKLISILVDDGIKEVVFCKTTAAVFFNPREFDSEAWRDRL